MTSAELIKKYRTKAKMSQYTLATSLGYKQPQFISNIERGIANLPHKHIRKTEKLLGIPDGDLGRLMVKEAIISINKRMKS